MTRSRLTFLAAALLPLAGCISFGPKLPPSLLTLTAATPLAAGTAATTDDAHAVAVALPSAPQALMTQRLMVQASPTEVAYLKDAQWAAPPAQLFRSLLAETITVRTGRVVPDPRLLSTQPNTRLSGQLTRFGLDAGANAVEVVFDAALTHEGSPTLQARRFSARVPVSSQAPVSVGQALNQAANDVAVQVADWVGR
jgi:cholesterol transport system auxiliary component